MVGEALKSKKRIDKPIRLNLIAINATGLQYKNRSALSELIKPGKQATILNTMPNKATIKPGYVENFDIFMLFITF